MRYSEESGFGVVPRPPTETKIPNGIRMGTPEHQQYMNYVELDTLLSNMTAAAEAAIKPISIAFHITKLTGGNIAARGNTSCLLQKLGSRLGKGKVGLGLE